MDMSLLQTKMKPATPLPELQTVEDIYRWIDENIAYGWQDKDGGTHTSEMKDFRRLYRTMSVTETLRQKIGTCIEQVALMHELLDAIGIPDMVKYLLSSSNVAEHPPRLAQAILAPTFIVLSK